MLAVHPVEYHLWSAAGGLNRGLPSSIPKGYLTGVKNKPIARKSIVAAKDISKGESFTEDNLTVKRPGTGISPMRWDEILGNHTQKKYVEDELI